MSWDDFNEIIYDGSKEEIAAVSCPECGSPIHYCYTPSVRSFSLFCAACGTCVRAHGSPKPNCARFFGLENTLPITQK